MTSKSRVDYPLQEKRFKNGYLKTRPLLHKLFFVSLKNGIFPAFAWLLHTFLRFMPYNRETRSPGILRFLSVLGEFLLLFSLYFMKPQWVDAFHYFTFWKNTFSENCLTVNRIVFFVLKLHNLFHPVGFWYFGISKWNKFFKNAHFGAGATTPGAYIKNVQMFTQNYQNHLFLTKSGLKMRSFW